jgi:hypothetical protein
MMPSTMGSGSSQRPTQRRKGDAGSPTMGGMDRLFLSSDWMAQTTSIRRRAWRLSLKAMVGSLGAIIAVSVALWTGGVTRVLSGVVTIVGVVVGGAASIGFARFRRQHNIDH